MIAAIFYLIFGFIAIWFGIKFTKLYIKVKNWAIIEATVISKNIEKHKRYSSGRSPYAVRVDYKYKYNLKEFFNNTVYLAELMTGQVNHMERQAKKVIEKLENTIKIYVNQNNPQQSVIFCNGIILYLAVVLMGSIGFLIGLLKLLALL